MLRASRLAVPPSVRQDGHHDDAQRNDCEGEHLWPEMRPERHAE